MLRTYEATNYAWSWTEDHVYRGSTLLASVTPGGTTHLHTDHLGTVRATTSSAGTRTAYHLHYPSMPSRLRKLKSVEGQVHRVGGRVGTLSDGRTWLPGLPAQVA